jgi:hypothetical protein
VKLHNDRHRISRLTLRSGELSKARLKLKFGGQPFHLLLFFS